MSSPAEYYTQQKDKYSQAQAEVNRKINNIARLRLWVAIGAIVAGIAAFRSGAKWEWWAVGAAAVLYIILVRIHHGLENRKEILDTQLLLINNELKALEGDITPFADGGAYTNTAHPYSYDLDIFGKGSVYQLLCRTVTNGGASLLADRLQKIDLSIVNITRRQEIIKELSTQPEILQQYRVAGTRVPEGKKDQARLKEWLQAPDLFINNLIIRIAAVVMPALTVGCIIRSAITGTDVSGIGLVIVVNWVLLGIFQKSVRPSVEQIGNIAPLIDKYTALLTEISMGSYQNAWLKEVGDNAKKSLKDIQQFEKLVRLFDSRENGIVGPLMNSLVLFDFYCLLRLESWRKKHSTLLLRGIDDMIAVDVYVSCAVYAFNHPENIYPRINTTDLVIHARELKHPLLSPATAVGNDVSLGSVEQFYLLTGANMTGKSTFIRTIGVSNVLSNIGLPLPAKELSMPLLDLYTSMRITDSVQDDISYFRAELNRIKTIMDMVKASAIPYMVLLDEPLRGTNSTDKQQGTRAIVENLLTYHAVGIVATHDTGLCDMEADHAGRVSNYHFESKVAEKGLEFDFKLKRGASTSNNATILMRQMGIVK